MYRHTYIYRARKQIPIQMIIQLNHHILEKDPDQPLIFCFLDFRMNIKDRGRVTLWKEPIDFKKFNVFLSV